MNEKDHPAIERAKWAPRLLHQEARELGRALVAEQSRIGFSDAHDPLVQPAMQEAASMWLEKWKELLHDDVPSAVGPLASLLAEVYEVTVGCRIEATSCTTCGIRRALTHCAACFDDEHGLLVRALEGRDDLRDAIGRAFTLIESDKAGEASDLLEAEMEKP